MLWSIDTCQNKVSADQHQVTISRAQVHLIEVTFFLCWPLTKCWFSIGSQAHVRLTCWKPGSWHWLWLFNHAWWKGEEDRWNYFQRYTKPNLRVAAILAWFWWLCMEIEKLHHSLTVHNFVECTINKKSHDLLTQFVINRYSWFWKFSNCTRLNFQNHSYLLITNCTRGRAISYTNFCLYFFLYYCKLCYTYIKLFPFCKQCKNDKTWNLKNL